MNSYLCLVKDLIHVELDSAFIHSEVNHTKDTSVVVSLITQMNELKLAIVKGRHNAINLENRLCILCDSIQVCVIEDEFHFLLLCPLFNELRDNFL